MAELETTEKNRRIVFYGCNTFVEVKATSVVMRPVNILNVRNGMEFSIYTEGSVESMADIYLQNTDAIMLLFGCLYRVRISGIRTSAGWSSGVTGTIDLYASRQVHISTGAQMPVSR